VSSNDQMDKALQKVSQFYNEGAAKKQQLHFQRVREMPGANRLFRRIADASDIEQLQDYLAEVRYALVFAGLGFQVEIEPYGSTGPDLRVSRDKHLAVTEIMRFRRVYPGPPELDLSDESTVLPEYGDFSRDVQKAFGKILAKFRQIGNEASIIAIWNDEEELEELEVEMAINYLRQDVARNHLSLPNGLQYVLYGSKWVRAGDNKQLHCFPVRCVDEPYRTWQQELEASTIDRLIQHSLAQSAQH